MRIKILLGSIMKLIGNILLIYSLLPMIVDSTSDNNQTGTSTTQQLNITCLTSMNYLTTANADILKTIDQFRTANRKLNCGVIAKNSTNSSLSQAEYHRRVKRCVDVLTSQKRLTQIKADLKERSQRRKDPSFTNKSEKLWLKTKLSKRKSKAEIRSRPKSSENSINFNKNTFETSTFNDNILENTSTSSVYSSSPFPERDIVSPNTSESSVLEFTKPTNLENFEKKIDNESIDNAVTENFRNSEPNLISKNVSETENVTEIPTTAENKINRKLENKINKIVKEKDEKPKKPSMFASIKSIMRGDREKNSNLLNSTKRSEESVKDTENENHENLLEVPNEPFSRSPLDIENQKFSLSNGSTKNKTNNLERDFNLLKPTEFPKILENVSRENYFKNSLRINQDVMSDEESNFPDLNTPIAFMTEENENNISTTAEDETENAKLTPILKQENPLKEVKSQVLSTQNNEMKLLLKNLFTNLSNADNLQNTELEIENKSSENKIVDPSTTYYEDGNQIPDVEASPAVSHSDLDLLASFFDRVLTSYYPNYADTLRTNSVQNAYILDNSTSVDTDSMPQIESQISSDFENDSGFGSEIYFYEPDFYPPLLAAESSNDGIAGKNSKDAIPANSINFFTPELKQGSSAEEIEIGQKNYSHTDQLSTNEVLGADNEETIYLEDYDNDFIPTTEVAGLTSSTDEAGTTEEGDDMDETSYCDYCDQSTDEITEWHTSPAENNYSNGIINNDGEEIQKANISLSTVSTLQPVISVSLVDREYQNDISEIASHLQNATSEKTPMSDIDFTTTTGTIEYQTIDAKSSLSNDSAVLNLGLTLATESSNKSTLSGRTVIPFDNLNNASTDLVSFLAIAEPKVTKKFSTVLNSEPLAVKSVLKKYIKKQGFNNNNSTALDKNSEMKYVIPVVLILNSNVDINRDHNLYKSTNVSTIEPIELSPRFSFSNVSDITRSIGMTLEEPIQENYVQYPLNKSNNPFTDLYSQNLDLQDLQNKKLSPSEYTITSTAEKTNATEPTFFIESNNNFPSTAATFGITNFSNAPFYLNKFSSTVPPSERRKQSHLPSLNPNDNWKQTENNDYYPLKDLLGLRTSHGNTISQRRISYPKIKTVVNAEEFKTPDGFQFVSNNHTVFSFNSSKSGANDVAVYSKANDSKPEDALDNSFKSVDKQNRYNSNTIFRIEVDKHCSSFNKKTFEHTIGKDIILNNVTINASRNLEDVDNILKNVSLVPLRSVVGQIFLNQKNSMDVNANVVATCKNTFLLGKPDADTFKYDIGKILNQIQPNSVPSDKLQNTLHRPPFNFEENNSTSVNEILNNTLMKPFRLLLPSTAGPFLRNEEYNLRYKVGCNDIFVVLKASIQAVEVLLNIANRELHDIHEFEKNEKNNTVSPNEVAINSSNNTITNASLSHKEEDEIIMNKTIIKSFNLLTPDVLKNEIDQPSGHIAGCTNIYVLGEGEIESLKSYLNSLDQKQTHLQKTKERKQLNDLPSFGLTEETFVRNSRMTEENDEVDPDMEILRSQFPFVSPKVLQNFFNVYKRYNRKNKRDESRLKTRSQIFDEGEGISSNKLFKRSMTTRKSKEPENNVMVNTLREMFRLRNAVPAALVSYSKNISRS